MVIKGSSLVLCWPLFLDLVGCKFFFLTDHSNSALSHQIQLQTNTPNGPRVFANGLFVSLRVILHIRKPNFYPFSRYDFAD